MDQFGLRVESFDAQSIYGRIDAGPVADLTAPKPVDLPQRNDNIVERRARR